MHKQLSWSTEGFVQLLQPCQCPLTSLHPGLSTSWWLLAWRGWPALTGFRTTLSPMTTCREVQHQTNLHTGKALFVPFFFIMEVMGGNHLFAVWRDASLSIPPGFCLVQNLAHQTQSLRQNPLCYWTQSLAEEADWDLVQDKWWLIDKFIVFRCKYTPGLNPRAHWSLWPPGFRKILHPSDSDFAKEGIKMAMHLNISHEQEHVTSLLPHSSYPKWWRILILSWQHWKPRC